LEFSPELHLAALANVKSYRSETQKCRAITPICVDFTNFQLPLSPLILYFHNPASRDVMAEVASNIASSLREYSRPIFVVYVTPTYDVFEAGPLGLRKIVSSGDKFAIYGNTTA
jgi:hypothetical protein